MRKSIMKYVIFGAGHIGEKILAEYGRTLEIETIFDNYAGGGITGGQ